MTRKGERTLCPKCAMNYITDRSVTGFCTVCNSRTGERPREIADRTHGKKVRCIETGEVYVNTGEAALATGVKKAGITTAIHRKRANYGYHWEYV